MCSYNDRRNVGYMITVTSGYLQEDGYGNVLLWATEYLTTAKTAKYEGVYTELCKMI